jgi:hypothetical protein
MFLNVWDINPHLLMFAIQYFGPTPRICFSASISETNMMEHKSLIQGKVKLIPFMRSLETLVEGVVEENEVSHAIFHIKPSENRLMSNIKVVIASDPILDLVTTLLKDKYVDGALQFYNLLKSHPFTTSVSGHIWENRIHAFLKPIDSPRTFRIRPLDSGDSTNTVEWEYPGGGEVVLFSEKQLGPLLLENYLRQSNCYFRPYAHNFPTVDALIFLPSELICIQITNAETHDINVKGLQTIQSCLKNELSHLRPTVEQPWRFIFVIPEAQGRKFKLQTLKGERVDKDERGEKEERQIWKKKIRQYVLEVKEQELFRHEWVS